VKSRGPRGDPRQPRRIRRTTVGGKPPARPLIAPPPHRPVVAKPTLDSRRARPATRRIARFIDDEETTLLDMLDNLLNKGVVLNAEVILALANVDLVYVRLSAILCAADRVLPHAK
jgi:hypothetical protein